MEIDDRLKDISSSSLGMDVMFLQTKTKNAKQNKTKQKPSEFHY